MAEPGFMRSTMARVTTWGVRVPATSTAPISDVGGGHGFGDGVFVGQAGFGAWHVFDDVAQFARIAVERGDARAGRGCAARMAAKPTDPAPSTTTRAGGTPGVPPSRMPRPPELERIRCAAMGMVICPAISLMAASTGRRPSSCWMISHADGGYAPLRQRFELRAVRHRHVVEGHQRGARTADASSSAAGPADFGEQFDALDHLGRRVGDVRAGANIIAVAEHGAIARAAFHPHRVAARQSGAAPPRASAPPGGRTPRAPG